MTMGTGAATTRQTITVQVDTGSLAWKFYTMAEDYERLKHTFDLCSQTTDRQRERIAILERENEVMRTLVESQLAVDRGITDFTLHDDAVERLRDAWANYFAMTEGGR